jgi:translation elongation factor EF-Tu-like GTPase
MRSLIVGTAGHIDHGKSALVRALTATVVDRSTDGARSAIHSRERAGGFRGVRRSTPLTKGACDR